MKKPKTKPKSNSAGRSVAPSEEYKAFEDLAKRVLSVPKSEIDKREAEAKGRQSAKEHGSA